MSWLKSAWFILTLKCDQSTRLASESLDRDLSWTERAAMRLHKMICRYCRRFYRQIVGLREAARMRQDQAAHLSGETLSSQARARIVDVLNRAEDAESTD